MRRILVCGDAMLDEYIHGEVNRISPEAPVPVLNNIRFEHRLGGACNVANNLSKLGIETTLLSIQGQNSYNLNKLLMESDINDFSIRDKDNTTITKTRYVSNNHQLLRVDNEKPFTNQSKEQLLSTYLGLRDNFDVIVLSDYNKGTICKGMIEGSSAMVIVDPKGTDWEKYRGADLITPNRKELKDVIGEWESEYELDLRVGKLITDLDIEYLLLTRSEDGATLFNQLGKVKDYPTQAQQIIDVTGCGDTVVATIAYALSDDYTLDEAIKLAMKAAGIVAGKFGTSYVTTQEIPSPAQ
jgi:rfaE bifunctional protein kinase chain/domain